MLSHAILFLNLGIITLASMWMGRDWTCGSIAGWSSALGFLEAGWDELVDAFHFHFDVVIEVVSFLFDGSFGAIAFLLPLLCCFLETVADCFEGLTTGFGGIKGGVPKFDDEEEGLSTNFYFAFSENLCLYIINFLACCSPSTTSTNTKFRFWSWEENQ